VKIVIAEKASLLRRT